MEAVGRINLPALDTDLEARLVVVWAADNEEKLVAPVSPSSATS